MSVASPLDVSPVIPVVQLPTHPDPSVAGVALARALVAGGVAIIEVTLRTEGAVRAIRSIREQVPEILVGAGSVLDVGGLDASLTAGAQFIVTPGTSQALRAALGDVDVPVLPGAGSVSEVLELRDAGHAEIKVFPAEPLGGPAFLKALLGPVAGVRICPTGGITQASAPAYLELDRVPCVGGSWLTPPDLVITENWPAITALARAASDR
ncbi:MULTISPECIES: bifunctional 4-hydroxy-2-oxoglutarate aldolase/2-dehydro-3-deoxy-phosphogluconate aldolase [unclassified Knoellia]|uniref:bifunctional 4-hydroxy-2-oxoglutarate aldolase/2-dehydro-3-deoxy-phosphogluconate aldolase n=1 Tax=Knoellia altitudinis TaxID=3404795 RepID=UPI00360EA8FC